MYFLIIPLFVHCCKNHHDRQKAQCIISAFKPINVTISEKGVSHKRNHDQNSSKSYSKIVLFGAILITQITRMSASAVFFIGHLQKKQILIISGKHNFPLKKLSYQPWLFRLNSDTSLLHFVLKNTKVELKLCYSSQNSNLKMPCFWQVILKTEASYLKIILVVL